MPQREGRAKAIWLIILVIAPLLATGTSHLFRAAHGLGDFEGSYANSRAVLEVHRLSLENPDTMGLYPPSARPILVVHALLPLMPAAVVWYIIYAGFHLTACYLVARCVCGLEPPHRFAGTLITWGFSLPWIWSDLATCNVTSILVICTVGSYVLHTRGRTWLAACVLSVGIAIKFLPAAVLGYYLWRRRFRMIGATLLCTVVIGVVPGLLWFGPRNFAEGWSLWVHGRMLAHSPMAAAEDHSLCTFQNQSLIATLTRLFTDVDAGQGQSHFQITKVELSSRAILGLWLVAMAVPLVAWVLLMVLRGRATGPPLLEGLCYAFFVLMMIWFSPQVRTYYMALLSLPLGVLGICGFKRRLAGDRDRFVDGALALYLLLSLSFASAWLRAHGTYQMIVLLLGTVTIVRVLRFPDGLARSGPDTA
ncbi:MAG: DUF2029 domain-containing protein [Phycisphaerae bacterium]|nr:DUF2029 domain-containing protein [Phycisphaerae bacterium]